jgi:hypothetical protein
LIFKRHVEFVLAQEGGLGRVIVRDEAADVVVPFAGRIDLFIPGEPAEEIDSQLRPGVGVSGHKAAETPSFRRHGLGLAIALNQVLRLHPQGVIGQAQIMQVVYFVESERVVRDRKIGLVDLGRAKHLPACIKPVNVAVVGMKKQIRLVGNFHFVFLRQHASEKIVRLAHLLSKIAEVDIDWGFGVHVSKPVKKILMGLADKTVDFVVFGQKPFRQIRDALARDARH